MIFNDSANFGIMFFPMKKKVSCVMSLNYYAHKIIYSNVDHGSEMVFIIGKVFHPFIHQSFHAIVHL